MGHRLVSFLKPGNEWEISYESEPTQMCCCIIKSGFNDVGETTLNLYVTTSSWIILSLHILEEGNQTWIKLAL